MVEVVYTDEFEEWFLALADMDAKSVMYVVDLLEEEGVTLRAPHSSAIRGSKYPLRELRPKQGRSPIRVMYAFDPLRQAVLLIGGNKSGDKTFYARIVPEAEAIWKQYLAEQRARRRDKESR